MNIRFRTLSWLVGEFFRHTAYFIGPPIFDRQTQLVPKRFEVTEQCGNFRMKKSQLSPLMLSQTQRLLP